MGKDSLKMKHEPNNMQSVKIMECHQKAPHITIPSFVEL
jgi:hypothetical protein